MKHLGFASLSAVRQYLRFAEHKRIDIAPLISAANISNAQLKQENGRVKGEQFQALIRKLIEISGDSLTGLKCSVFVSPDSYNLLGQIVLHCATLEDAIAHVPPFERLVGDMGTTELTRKESSLLMRWHCAYDDAMVIPVMVDNVLASWTLFARNLIQRQEKAERVYFQRKAPESKTELQAYYQFFGHQIEFEVDMNAILLNSRMLTLPIQSLPNHNLSSLEKIARSQISSLELEGENFSQRVLRSIEAHLQLGSINKNLIAQEYNMCERSLQRHLAAEGTRYQALVDQARFARTKTLLSDNHLSADEIAINLGFSDVRSYFRSFKRWTGGLTPREFMQQSKAGG